MFDHPPHWHQREGAGKGSEMERITNEGEQKERKTEEELIRIQDVV